MPRGVVFLSADPGQTEGGHRVGATARGPQPWEPVMANRSPSVDQFAVDHVEPSVKHVRTGVDDLKLGQPCSHRLKYSSSDPPVDPIMGRLAGRSAVVGAAGNDATLAELAYGCISRLPMSR